MTARDDSPVEAYLDDLLGKLRGRPSAVRRALAEADDHLHQAVAAHVAAAMDPRDAEARAVAEFGDAGDVAAGFNRSGAMSLPQLAATMVRQLLPVATIGLLAVGLSGAVEQAMTWMWGRVFVFADPPGTTYPASACHHWLSIHRAAHTCTQAFLAESNADNVQARVAMGLFGLLLAVGLFAWTRRRRGPLPTTAPIALLSGLVAFGVAGLGLVALGIDRLQVADGHGAGQWFSAAAVALPVAVAYAVAFVRHARRSGLPSW